MMYKLLLGLSCLASYSFADCTFKIINYSQSAITVEVGFYNSIKQTKLIEPAANGTEIKLKSNYQCNSTNDFGMSKAYLKFPKDPNYGGANYSAANNSINLMGLCQDKSGCEVRANDGTRLWLNADGHAINAEKFEVKLNFTGLANSKSAGTP